MIFGISGFKGSGKDEFFKVLSDLVPTYKKLAFADPIKTQIQCIFNLQTEQEYDDFKRKEFEGVSGRHVVREIGMLMRSYNESQFVEYVYSNLTKNCCITDVRFQNEMTFIQKLKEKNKSVYLVKIKRYNSNDDHITEQEFADAIYDFVIDNNGTIEEFKEKVIKLYKGLIWK